MRPATEEKRTRILHAGLGEFCRHGYEGASIRPIARAAGCSLGGFYHYFPGKAELLDAIFEQGVNDIMTTLDDFSAGGFDSYLQTVFRILEENRQFWILLHGIRHQEFFRVRLSHRMNELNAAVHSRLSGLLSGRDETDVSLFFALIDGITALYLAGFITNTEALRRRVEFYFGNQNQGEIT